MIPNSFSFLSSIPLSPNGKINRNALPDPETNKPSRLSLAPRDNVERQLLAIWEQLITTRPIGIEDDFFTIGGHSLLAIRMVTEIEKGFGKRLPLHQIFAHSSIAALGALLRDAESASDASCLVGIRTSGSYPPLFFLPGAGGGVSYLYPLALALDPEIPFFTFQALGLDGSAPPDERIETMAERYVHSLRQVQPHGPYHLGGHSLGGIVAFAMAQALLRQGESVALLAIVDSIAPGLPHISPGRQTTALSDLLFELTRLLVEIGQQEMTLEHSSLSCLSLENQIIHAAHFLEQRHLLPVGEGACYLENLLHVYQTQLQAADDFRPTLDRLPPVTLLLSTESADLATSEIETGWHRYSCQPIHLHLLPGDHMSMMTPPHVQTLAKVLEQTMTGDLGRAIKK